MKIIKEASFEHSVEYRWDFRWKDGRGGGFGFKCDKHGNHLNPNRCAKENFRKCVSGEYDVEDLGIVRYEQTIKHAAIGLCVCGEEVDLFGFTNTCDCGRDYNSAGQELAPHEQWGEETGESLSDILRIP